jgi:hypothetical protein
LRGAVQAAKSLLKHGIPLSVWKVVMASSLTALA